MHKTRLDLKTAEHTKVKNQGRTGQGNHEGLPSPLQEE
jgi:hypothetical protein